MLTANQTGATYQWINCDTNLPISGENDQTFTASNNGNYAVEVSIGNCLEISDCFPVNSLDIANVQLSEYKIYPNPMSTILNIDLPDFQEANFKILNLNGQVVLNEKIYKKNQQIDVAGFSKGIYFIQLQIDGLSISKKLVK